MTSLLTTANTYGWAGKNLRAGLGAVLRATGSIAPTSGNLSLSIFSGQYPSIQANSGVVTTLAGAKATASGFINGTGADARFNFPYGIAVDSTGNLYVADAGNNAIRKITSGGLVTTLAGAGPSSSGSADGNGAAARFTSPYGIAVDSTGNVYVADSFNYAIRKITSGGDVSTLAGLALNPGSADGIGSVARFDRPAGIAVDSTGNLYVADTYNNTIRKITSGGLVSTLAGLAGTGTGSADGTGSVARFSNPQGIAVDSTGNLYVADTTNYTIRKITSEGLVTTLAGLAGNFGSANGTGSVARFSSPHGIAVDPAGNVYVADRGNYTIRKITSGGVVTTLAGIAGSDGNTDGTGGGARFGLPVGIAIDSMWNLYVSQIRSSNMLIRKMT